MAVSDIVVSPATIYYGPVGTAMVDETTVAYGAAWGGAWVALGTTLQPVVMKYEREQLELEVQQALAPVKRKIVKETMALETTLAEMTSANLALVLAGTAATTAAGSAQKGYFQVEAGGEGEPTEYAFGIEGYSVVAGVKQPMRWLFYKSVVVPMDDLTFSKADPAGIGLHVDVVPDLTKSDGKNLMIMYRVTAAAT